MEPSNLQGLLISDAVSDVKQELIDDPDFVFPGIIMEENKLAETVKQEINSEGFLEEPDLIKSEEIDIKNEDELASKSSNCLGEQQHEESRVFKCHQCDYQPTQQSYLKERVFRDKNQESDQCMLKTIKKKRLKSHDLLDKTPADIDMFKCVLCDYRTIRKVRFNNHIFKHKNPEIKTFKCDICNYVTFKKDSLKMHFLTHNSPALLEEVNIFKCDQCDFQTIHKQSLDRHVLVHKNRKEVDMFKCDQCDFQTIHKQSVNRHLLLHKNHGELDIFNCDQCDFQTIHKKNLGRHLLLHRNREEVDMFKCDKCDFQTIHKQRLKRHVLLHKNTKKVDMFNVSPYFTQQS